METVPWFRFTSYHNKHTLLVVILLLALLDLLTQYNAQNDNRFFPLKESFPSVMVVKCNRAGTKLALLRTKKFTTGEEYTSSLEIWSLKGDMQFDKLLFKEGEKEGVIFIHPDLMWLDDDLVYAVLVGKEPFEQALNRWQKLGKQDPLLGDTRFGADDIEQFQLRLWDSHLRQSKIIKKGVCGISRDRNFLPLWRKKSFILIDPENEWSIFRLLYTDPKTIKDLYDKQRILEICELEGEWLKILKNLKIEGIHPTDHIVGITSDDKNLVFLCTHIPIPLNLQMLRLKLWRFRVLNLDEKSIYSFDLELPTHGECEVKLIGNHLRVIHSDMELFNIKYFNLKGELVDQNVIPTIRI
ncbi:MAG: hypothetical protein NZ531_05970, partial [Aquificaceae bacterium]|nr:hypothetical protein [Aquificaceae bacterium]